jgi:beta-lactam-binding protein with PASTA domain
VPKLRGLKLKQAKKRLHAAHCQVGKVSRKRSKRTLAGRVVSSRPRARAVRPSGTRVALVIGRRR